MNNYPLTVLYDASCPLCQLEIDNLQARNHRELLRFVDIAGKQIAAAEYGATQAEMMRIIHALRPDGSLVKGVEVFRLAYAAVDLGWITAPTAWPLLKPLFDWAYPHVARHRYRLSGKLSGLLFLIAARRAERRSRSCKDGVCTQRSHTGAKS